VRDELTLASALLRAAGRNPEKVALICDGEELRYRTLADNIQRVAAAAAGLGLPPRANLTLLAPNCLEYVELVAGLSGAGHPVVTANPHLTAPELRKILEDSESAALFVHPACEEVAREASAGQASFQVVLGDAYAAWRSTGNPTPLPEVPETETFAISYTSGTTGAPKGVMLSHRSRVLTFLAMSATYGCYGPDDHAVATAPLYHGGGFAFGVAPLVTGGTVTVMPKFEPELLLRTLRDSAATNVFVVPTHVSALFQLPRSVLRGYSLPQLRAIISNAAPLPQASKEQLVDHFGEGLLYECYGSTEGGIVSNLPPEDQLRKRDCVGLPFPCTEIAILDEEGRPTPRETPGQVYTRSPYLFNGYWKRPEETAAIMRGDWLTAGDLGRFDSEGYLYIEGRSKDMIITGGVNVYPSEIEHVLEALSGIAEAVVVGVPDDYWGERVVACVRATGEPVETAALEKHCEERLAKFKRPKEFRFVDDFPRNPTGKLLRRVLRQEIEASK